MPIEQRTDLGSAACRMRGGISIVVLALCEGLAVYLAATLGGVVLYFMRDIALEPYPNLLFVPGWWLISAMLRLLPGWGMGIVEALRRIQIGLLALFAIAGVVIFLGRMMTESRIAFLTGYVFAIFLVPLCRVAGRVLLIKRGLWGRQTVVYGDKTTLPRVIELMRGEVAGGYVPVGAFSQEYTVGSHIEGVEVLGTLEQIANPYYAAIIALSGERRGERANRLLEGPLSFYRKVILMPDLNDTHTLWVQPRDFQGVLGLEISQNLLDQNSQAIKRSMDILLVLLSLPVWLPLFLLIAVIIRLEDGGFPFFIQPRLGRNGQPFNVIKFRTMRLDAEEWLREQLNRDEALRQEWEQHHKLKVDPRITLVGKILRMTSLDELPQFLNVIRGDMSLVGPRPLPNYHYVKLPAYVRNLRRRVRPGITGLWQVSGRSECGTEGMEKWDPYYVRNWSPWLDIVILVRTIRAVLTGRGAY